MMKTFLLMLLALAAAACGPIYETEYSYHPPADPQSRACIAQCNSGKEHCRVSADDKAENERLRCNVEASDEYERCLLRAGNDDARKQCSKRSCYESTDTSICEADFRSCFQSCGGIVESRQVCTLNCP